MCKINFLSFNSNSPPLKTTIIRNVQRACAESKRVKWSREFGKLWVKEAESFFVGELFRELNELTCTVTL